MARCRMKGLDAQGSNASRNRNTRLGTSQRPRAGAVDIECAALISGLSLSEQPFRTNHQHHDHDQRSEEHTSELQSLMRISYAVFCLKKKTKTTTKPTHNNSTQTHTHTIITQ